MDLPQSTKNVWITQLESASLSVTVYPQTHQTVNHYTVDTAPTSPLIFSQPNSTQQKHCHSEHPEYAL